MNNVNYDNMSEQEAKDYFNKNYNISYYDENLPTPSNELLFMHYISSAIIYAFAMLLILFNPFYVNTFGKYDATTIIISAYLGYLIIAPIFLFTIRSKTVYASHSIEIINYFLKIIKRQGLKKNANSAEFIQWLTPTYKQKQSFILYFIKFFFGPQLILWSFQHLQGIISNWGNLERVHASLKGYRAEIFSLVKYRHYVFLVFIQFMYFIDCFVFAVGYCTELTFLKNRIRTVESTALGLIFCLACYPPVSSVTASIVTWRHEDHIFNIANNPAAIINWIFYIIAAFLIFIYVAASVALFTKASNLTNRGTVSIFPYNIIRHPAYATKISLWWLASTIAIKNMFIHQQYLLLLFYLLSAITWSFIYYMRAITEERHLLLDPDYRAYTKKVKYKFIPFVW